VIDAKFSEVMPQNFHERFNCLFFLRRASRINYPPLNTTALRVLAR